MVETLTGLEAQRAVINEPNSLTLFALSEGGRASQVLESSKGDKPKNLGGSGPVDITVDCKVPKGTVALEFRSREGVVYRYMLDEPADQSTSLHVRLGVIIDCSAVVTGKGASD